MKKYLFWVTLMTLVLSGCIVVDDFKQYWNKGTVDPKLEGQWQDQGSKEPSVIFVRQEENYALVVPNETTPSELIRTLSIGKYTFMMIKTSKEDKGGDLIRYSVEGNALKFYTPNEKKKTEFQRFYKLNAVVFDEETIRFKEINAQIISMLQAVSGKPDYWELSGTYTKVP